MIPQRILKKGEVSSSLLATERETDQKPETRPGEVELHTGKYFIHVVALYTDGICLFFLGSLIFFDDS